MSLEKLNLQEFYLTNKRQNMNFLIFQIKRFVIKRKIKIK